MTGARAPGGWLQAVAGDAATAARLSETRQIKDMLRVEAAYSRALGAVGHVPTDMAEAAAQAIKGARIDTAALAREAATDGMPVPGLVRHLHAALPETLHPALHEGLTSQDVMDTALVLALAEILVDFEARIGRIEAVLARLKARFDTAPLMARTRMQAALPMTAGARIAAWARPLAEHRTRLAELRPRLLRLQLGGPIGTRHSLHGQGGAIARHMADALTLAEPGVAWHSDRSALAELAGWLSMLAGSLGKIGHDIALMAQQGVDAAQIAGGGGSSAMAHKKNPVGAEILVALARHAAVLVSGMHLALDHEQERSGVSWTLEWLVLPGLLTSAGAALGRAEGLLEGVDALGEAPTGRAP